MIRDALYVEKISTELESRDKELIYFRCHDFFEDQRTAIQAARALKRHLKRSGGRLGGFLVKPNGSNRLKHGILWEATRIKNNPGNSYKKCGFVMNINAQLFKPWEQLYSTP